MEFEQQPNEGVEAYYRRLRDYLTGAALLKLHLDEEYLLDRRTHAQNKEWTRE